MALSFRAGQNSSTGSSAASSLTATLPSYQAGDLLVLVAAGNGAFKASSATGWTAVGSIATASPYLYQYAIAATAGMSAPVLSFNNNLNACAWIGAYGGVGSTLNRATTTTTSGSATTTITIPTLTTTANDLVIASAAWYSSGAGTATFAATSGWTERSDQATSAATGNICLGVEEEWFPAGGATGSISYPASASGDVAGIAAMYIAGTEPRHGFVNYVDPGVL